MSPILYEVAAPEAQEFLYVVAANSTEVASPVAQRKATAVPIVGRLQPCILRLTGRHTYGAPLAAKLSPALLGRPLLPTLPKERMARPTWLWMVEAPVAFVVYGVEHGMAHADCGASPTVSGKEVVGAYPPGLWGRSRNPIDEELVDRFKTQPRDDGRDVALRGQESDGGQVQSGIKDVAPA